MAGTIQSNNRRVLAVLLCVLLVLTLTAASVYMARSAHHDCCGTRCVVCACARRCGELLRGLWHFLASVVLTAVVLACAASAAVIFLAPFTLTAQSVKLND